MSFCLSLWKIARCSVILLLPLILFYLHKQDTEIISSALNQKMHFSISVCLMVFNATFNNISVISWRSVLLVEETGVPEENH